MVSLASKEYVFPASAEEADFVQIIERSLSDINYVQSLEGHVQEVVLSAYVGSIKNTHGESILPSVQKRLFTLTTLQYYPLGLHA